METGFMNRIIGLVIALVVGGLLVGGLLIPSIEGMTTEEYTKHNEGVPFEIVNDDTDLTIVVSNDGNTNSVVVNDVDMSEQIIYGSYAAFRLAYGENYFITLGSNGYVVLNPVTADYNERSMNSASAAVTIVVTSEEMSITPAGGSTTTYDAPIACISDSKDAAYVFTKLPGYVNDTSVFYFGGYTGSKATARMDILGNGTIDELEYITYPSSTADPTPTQTIESYKINTTSKGTNLYTLDSLTFVWDVDGADSTITYNQFIIPKEVIYKNGNYVGETNAILMGVISLLGIVALVVVAANGIRNKY